MSIKKNIPSEFNFRKVSQKEVENVISNLNTEKAIQGHDKPTKFIKVNNNIFSNFIKK